MASEPAGLPEGGKARRVYLLLKDDILNGRCDGGLLPGEQRLAEIHGVSRVTIRRALDGLAADGLIERRAGAGTTVRRWAEEAPQVAGDMTSLMPQVAEMGRSTTARLLSFAYCLPSEAVRSAMGLAAGEKVQTAVRVRLVDDMPFSYLTTHVPADVAGHYSENDLATTPLYKLLERSGVRIATAEQSVSATLAAPDVAEALSISSGSALLSLRRVLRDDDGRGVEYLAALYRPDLFRLDMTLSRAGEDGGRYWEPKIGEEEPEA